MIRGCCLRIYHQTPAELEAQIGALATMGANSVALVVSHYTRLVYNPATGDNEIAFPPAGISNKAGHPWLIFPDLGEPIGPYANTPSAALVYHAASYAKQRGLAVWIKPHIDPLNLGRDGHWYPGGWRGYAVLPQPLRHGFVWSYFHRFMADYIAIADELDCRLIFGTEFYSITKQHGAAIWLEILAKLRATFDGPLTYSANWGGWADDAEWVRLKDLWPACDYIGISAYFPLPSVDWHYKPFDWHPPLDDWLTGFSRQVGKPLLFTEWGYPNSRRAAVDPMGDPLPSDTRDDALQLQLATVGLERWHNAPEWAGFLWWEADRGDGAPISHQAHAGSELPRVLFENGEK